MLVPMSPALWYLDVQRNVVDYCDELLMESH